MTVTKADGSELPVLCMVYTAADGKMFICLTLPEEAQSATESTANANAKTLYNMAAEVCYNRSEAKDPIPDGEYSYTVGEKYDDDFGKYINEVYGTEDSFKGAVCEIKVEKGDVVYALYTPAGQSDVTGAYPER